MYFNTTLKFCDDWSFFTTVWIYKKKDMELEDKHSSVLDINDIEMTSSEIWSYIEKLCVDMHKKVFI